MADEISSFIGYFIPQLNLLSICTCMSSQICNVLFLFYFFGLSYCRVPKIQYPTKCIETQSNGDTDSVCRLMGMTLERVMTVWISNTSLGWSLCPCRCSQLHAGSSSCFMWAGTCSVTQCFRAGKGMRTGLLFPSSVAQLCPGRAKSSLTSFTHSWHSSGMAVVGISI